jgi:hypothetical protein
MGCLKVNMKPIPDKDLEAIGELYGELYQVVSSLADMAGVWEDPEVTKVLDVLASKKPWKHKGVGTICPFAPQPEKASKTKRP